MPQLLPLRTRMSKLALTMSLNPEYQAMGRGIFTADVVNSLMKQAESGQIPVLGQGYRGPFSGRL